jgi:hypothetical protein
MDISKEFFMNVCFRVRFVLTDFFSLWFFSLLLLFVISSEAIEPSQTLVPASLAPLTVKTIGLSSSAILIKVNQSATEIKNSSFTISVKQLTGTSNERIVFTGITSDESMKIDGLDAGVAYSCKVFWMDDQGKQIRCAMVTATPLKDIPSIQLIRLNAKRVLLNWEPVTGATR